MIEREDKIWYLKQNRLFANAPPDAVVEGAGIFTMELLPKRATFFDQGDATKVVYLIKTGRVRIARNTADGKEVTVAILGPGDMFGEDALFGGTERTTVATCMEETLICKAHADDLLGRPAEDGTFLDVRLTHQEIASIIGSTRETVSLEMNALVRSGHIKQENGYITVLARK